MKRGEARQQEAGAEGTADERADHSRRPSEEGEGPGRRENEDGVAVHPEDEGTSSRGRSALPDSCTMRVARIVGGESINTQMAPCTSGSAQREYRLELSDRRGIRIVERFLRFTASTTMSTMMSETLESYPTI